MMLWDTTPCHGATSIAEKLTVCVPGGMLYMAGMLTLGAIESALAKSPAPHPGIRRYAVE